MATKDMRMVLGGVTLPFPSTFLKKDDPNETDNVTEGGTLYTDFVNINRSWKVGWELISIEDYNTINTLFLLQYSEFRYHTLQFPAYSILTPVKMEKSQEEIKYNGAFVRNFSITLKEQYAFS